VSSQHYGWLGLGLYITRQIVEAHGGTIRAQNKPGQGAVFVMRLPTAPTAKMDAPDMEPPGK
jgi:signal transduction histidine kinase